MIYFYIHTLHIAVMNVQSNPKRPLIYFFDYYYCSPWSVVWVIFVSGASGKIHQVCLRNQQHWAAAYGTG